LINGVRVGGGTGRNAVRLKEGDNTLVLGSARSPYKFVLRVPRLP
jgi:hypothetical protein